MARFPQVDWVAVNGRDTPFTKPQHYKEGSTSETDLTGHDNPLPTTDKSVRAELESIKATQAKILERLDEPLDTQLTGSNFKDGIVTKPRKVETFSEGDIKVSAGSFVQYDSFSKDLEYGTIHDMREYSHVYFGGQSLSGAHHFYLLMRQKPFGTGGSMIIDDKTETSASSKYIKKTPIIFHNLSLRVYNDSEEEQSYILAAGFWPV